MKVVFKQDTKRVSDQLKYNDLVRTAHDVFGMNAM